MWTRRASAEASKLCSWRRNNGSGPPPTVGDHPARAYLFASKRGGPMTSSNVRKLVARAGVAADLPFPAHPHMLRHACGFKLANDGHDTGSLQHYLGHKNITHTVRYTEMAPDRFRTFWRD